MESNLKRTLLWLTLGIFTFLFIVPLQAQVVRDHRTKKTDDKVRDHRTKKTDDKVRDHRINEEQALESIDIFKEWVIGANQKGIIDAVLNPYAPIKSQYSIKGLENRKFLHFSHRIWWTKDASAKTEQDERIWLFYPKSKCVEDLEKGYSIRTMPILYGEPIALVTRDPKGNYNNRNILEVIYRVMNRGVNLLAKKRETPSELIYDWVILGGKTGSQVKSGDRIVLFNLTHRQPLIFYPRKNLTQVGWPDTKSDQEKPFLKDIKRTQLDKEIWDKLIK